MFEEQYNDLFTAVDLIAERIRALGEKAPGVYAKYTELTNLKWDNEDPDATSMVRELAEYQDVVIKTLGQKDI